MSGGDQQVIALFEQNGMSPEDIAEALGYDVLAVKTSLASYSVVYRRMMSERTPINQTERAGAQTPTTTVEDISDAEFDMIKQGLMSIAMDSSPENTPTRARTLKFLFQEKKGRNSVGKGMQNINVNILTINNGIAQAREAIKRALGSSQVGDKVVDI